jgi:hypothetical protein
MTTKNKTVEYWIDADERRYVIIPEEPGDDRWRNRGHTGLDLWVKGISRSPISMAKTACRDSYENVYGVDDIPAGDKAYVVVVEYTTGDTFGSDDTWCVAAIKASREDAEAAEIKCYAGNKLTERAFRPWDGYFEHLNSVRIEELEVKE